MTKRILQALAVVMLVQLSGATADAARGCRDMCWYNKGLCEGGGGTWHLNCNMIDPDYDGDCDLDAFCEYSVAD